MSPMKNSTLAAPLLRMPMLHGTAGCSSAGYLKRINGLGLRHHGLETRPPTQSHDQLRALCGPVETFKINAI